MEKIKVVILAAGKGSRMKSELPKAFMEVKGKPMLVYLHDSSVNAMATLPLVVISSSAEDLFKSKFPNTPYIIQIEQLGTGYALALAEKACADAEHIVVLYGDQPFIKSDTIKNLIAKHAGSGAKITFATTVVPNFENLYFPFLGFARILREGGELTAIREYKDANEEEKSIKEVNAGCYVFESKWLWENLKKIDKQNAQGEYYLTDLIPLAIENKEKVESMEIDPKEALGANSKEELEILEKFA